MAKFNISDKLKDENTIALFLQYAKEDALNDRNPALLESAMQTVAQARAKNQEDKNKA